MPNIPSLKKTLRKIIGEQRSLLPPQTQQQCSEKLTNHLIHHPLFLNSQNITAFWAHNNEIDPALVIKQALTLNKHCYLPILHINHLVFSKIDNHTQYKNNQYGIPEPESDPSHLINPQSLDLALVPLVAIDNKGNRLGMGGGFYDRTFSFKTHSKKPFLLGLAYEFQRLENIPHNAHDIPLDGVATENGIFLF